MSWSFGGNIPKTSVQKELGPVWFLWEFCFGLFRFGVFFGFSFLQYLTILKSVVGLAPVKNLIVIEQQEKERKKNRRTKTAWCAYTPSLLSARKWERIVERADLAVESVNRKPVPSTHQTMSSTPSQSPHQTTTCHTNKKSRRCRWFVQPRIWAECGYGKVSLLLSEPKSVVFYRVDWL
jgi:hypothetical protein